VPRIREYIALRRQSTARSKRLATLSRSRCDGVLHAKPHIAALPEDNVRTGVFERDAIEAVIAAIRKVDRRGRVRFENLQDVVRFGDVTGSTDFHRRRSTTGASGHRDLQASGTT
jgi:hypothetical protein